MYCAHNTHLIVHFILYGVPTATCLLHTFHLDNIVDARGEVPGDGAVGHHLGVVGNVGQCPLVVQTLQFGNINFYLCTNFPQKLHILFELKSKFV
jgi:hypothetical protein